MDLIPSWLRSEGAFDIYSYVATLSPEKKELLKFKEGRVLLTKFDPILFAYIYLREHITLEEHGRIVLAECHLDWARLAVKTWVGTNKEPRENRYAIIAPRETGKSTWWFLILPLWAAAHGYLKFISSFSSAATQGQNHLKNLKRELDKREYPSLFADFPDLCSPLMKKSGHTISDSAGMLIQKNGFTFSAHGMDSSSIAGVKSGSVRPDLIILDDVEPGEAVYSAEEVKKRITTIRDTIVPLGKNAFMVWSGYTTMVDSMVHQLVRYAKGEEPTEWITALNFKPKYYPPIVVSDLGEEQSFWPEVWSLDYLKSERMLNPRGYSKNFDNDPIDNEGTWWRKEDIKYGKLDRYDRTVLVVDGAVTTKKTSDYTGLCAVGLDIKGMRFFTREALEVRQAGEELRSTVLRIVEEHSVDYIIVEANQGGDLWYIVLHDMPVPIKTFSQKERKEYRIRRLLAAYQRDSGRVLHEREFRVLERRALAYPNTTHDDILDAEAAAVEHQTHMLIRTLGKSGDVKAVRKMSYLRT